MSRHKIFSLITISVIFLTLLMTTQPVQAQTKPVAKWRDSGLTLPAGTLGAMCFDGSQPNVLLVAGKASSSAAGGSYSYNWLTGETKLINDTPFTVCNDITGQAFITNRSVNGAIRLNGTKTIAHAPTEMAMDGTYQLYSLEDKRLFYSADNGDTWQERGQLFVATVHAVSVAQADARVVYVLTKSKFSKEEDFYSLYSSNDAGLNWQRQAQYRVINTTTFNLSTKLGRAAPVGSLLLYTTTKGVGSVETIVNFSGDGGRTFQEIDRTNTAFQVLTPENKKFYYTNEGLVRLTNRNTLKFSLELSLDNGKTWQSLGKPPALPNIDPPTADENGKPNLLQQSLAASPNLFLSNTDGRNSLFHSADGGYTWQVLDDNMTTILVSPYIPLTLLGIRSKKLYVMGVEDMGKSLSLKTISNAASDNLYLPETGHNLGGAFKKYWQANRGLAQFGFPQTEAFREINPTDGKVYTVQYFERNRFEYHPENAGSKYEVLLGLLGNQLTEKRRTTNDKAFGRVEDTKKVGGVYFAETGHNLGGTFKTYWDANGGLALYGFPISEEFEEVNPDDGKKYIVQYFERNRFEYHAENAGSLYEVLLGLLGNSLLKEKRWL